MDNWILYPRDFYWTYYVYPCLDFCGDAAYFPDRFVLEYLEILNASWYRAFRKTQIATLYPEVLSSLRHLYDGPASYRTASREPNL